MSNPNPKAHFDPGLIEQLYRHRIALFSLVVLMAAGVALLVFETGGSKYVWPHTMYVPIIVAAALFGPVGGAVAGLGGGLLLGPFMPLDTATGETQTTTSWLYRTLAFSGVGGFAGLLMHALRRQMEQLRWMASHDVNTGLPSYQTLVRDIEVRIRATAEGPFTLMLLNIENLSEVIDSFGFDTGNRLILAVGRRLREEYGDDLTIYHTHTNRLALFLPGDEPGEVHGHAARIAGVLQSPLPVGDLHLYASPRLGCVRCPGDGDDPLALIQRADIALSIADRHGTGFASYNRHHDATSTENLLLIADLMGAIRSEQLVLHFQPKIDIAKRAVCGCEALLRWHHPTNGLIPPGRFIPKAENTELIRPLTRWVLERAVAQASTWHRQGLPLEVAVNLSSRNLGDADLIDHLRILLSDSGLPPSLLELEITESAIMNDAEGAIATITALRGLGVRIAIDDFGTGYSSLAYLQRIPAHSLKIDCSFIADMLGDDRTRHIVESTIDLADHLGMESIAEGVETDAQFHALERLGCRHAQGYWIGRPMPAGEMEGWLRKAGWRLCHPQEA